MPTEIINHCPKHEECTRTSPVWPYQNDVEEIEGVRAIVFCDSYDTHGTTIVCATDGSHVCAFLHQDSNDTVGIEQDISKPIYFFGKKWVRIVSSRDTGEIHLRHKPGGDYHQTELKFTRLVPDPDLSLS